MKKIWKFWEIIIVDILGVVFIISSIALSWLPGPGGIPLFLIGLGLLSINHTWAKRYIHLTKQYADKFGTLIFREEPRLQMFYDGLSPLLLGGGIVVIVGNQAYWQLSLGIFLFFMGLTIFLGNRGRWEKVKELFKR